MAAPVPPAPYVHQPYPKWVYFADGRRPRIVPNRDAHLKEGVCYDSPADIPASQPPEAAVAPVQPAPAPTPPLKGEMVKVIANEAAVAIGKFHAAPAALVIDRVSHVSSLDELREIEDIEANRPGGARKTVQAAVAKQVARLTATAVEAEEAAGADEDGS